MKPRWLRANWRSKHWRPNRTASSSAQSTIALVVQAQRDLASDQSAETQSMANYTHARIAFDEAVGQTLEVNGISMVEAVSGRVARQSSIPEGR